MHKKMKPSALLSPIPAVMVSCKGKLPTDKPNIITIAWAGTICTNPPMVSISIRKSRYSYDIIKNTGEFAINLVNKDLVKSADYCGVKSGRDIDKYKACNLNTIKIDGLQYAVGIKQSPVILGCKVKQIIELGSHDLFIAQTVSVLAEDQLFDGEKLCLDKANLISYSHGEYFLQGKKLGFFGYSVASKKALARRRRVRPAAKRDVQSGEDNKPSSR